VIVVDANILLYAYDAGDPRHFQVASWLERVFSGSDDVGLPLTVLLAFARITSDPRVYETPRDPEEAISLIEGWLGRSNVQLIGPTQTHWKTLTRLVTAGKVRGSMLMDAHIAALAIEFGAILATTDRDFSRFPGLRTIDPTSDGASTNVD